MIVDCLVVIKRRTQLFFASLLLAESFHAVYELGHRAHHAAHDLCDEDLLARQVCQSLNASLVEVSAVAHAALDGQLLGLPYCL